MTAIRTGRGVAVLDIRRDRSYLNSLALAHAVVRKLSSDSELVQVKAAKNLPLVRSNVRGLALSWVDEWERLLAGPPELIAEALLRDDEHGADMRSVAPFAGTLTQSERIAAFQSVRDAE
jgi:hypothetical protein